MLGSLCARCQQKSRFVFVLPDFSERGRINFDNARTAVYSMQYMCPAGFIINDYIHCTFKAPCRRLVRCCFDRGIRSVIMSKSNLFIAGSIHQGYERFSDISRGRQCSFMSFSALLFAQNLPIEQWTAATVNQILVEGDRLYLDALRSRSIPDTEVLSLNYLPIMAYWSLETNSNYYLPITAQTHDCDDSLLG